MATECEQHALQQSGVSQRGVVDGCSVVDLLKKGLPGNWKALAQGSRDIDVEMRTSTVQEVDLIPPPVEMTVKRYRNPNPTPRLYQQTEVCDTIRQDVMPTEASAMLAGTCAEMPSAFVTEKRKDFSFAHKMWVGGIQVSTKLVQSRNDKTAARLLHIDHLAVIVDRLMVSGDARTLEEAVTMMEECGYLLIQVFATLLGKGEDDDSESEYDMNE
ncbi:predicted protein [Postia placenta Mad-698-R]|nr:predicted protein [Postia placenta Mad-698-R]